MAAQSATSLFLFVILATVNFMFYFILCILDYKFYYNIFIFTIAHKM